MTVFYLDTSVALRALLGHSPSAAAWIDQVTAEHTVVSSRILRTELTRVLRREGLPVTLRNEILDVLALVPRGRPCGVRGHRATREDCGRDPPRIGDRRRPRRHDRQPRLRHARCCHITWLPDPGPCHRVLGAPVAAPGRSATGRPRRVPTPASTQCQPGACRQLVIGREVTDRLAGLLAT